MNIDELRTTKKELEQGIAVLLENFVDSTSVEIEGVRVRLPETFTQTETGSLERYTIEYPFRVEVSLKL